jgi:hypothetical protein
LRSAGVDADGKLLAAPQQVIFSWFPRNTSSLNSATDTEYEFALYETRPAGRNPNDVVLTTPPIFRITTEQTQYVYGPTEPLLLEGMTYVWRVRAVDKGGIDAFRNQGYSEVCTFTYGGSDPDASLGAVKSVQAEGQTERRARVWWTADGTFDSYRVYFKKPGTQWEWFHEDTKTAEIKLYDLEPDNTYETRVQGRKNGVYGAYSDIVTFRTKPRRVFNCGDVPPPEPTTFSSQPLTDVIPGMVIVAGGMEITLTEIQPLDQPGWYKGVGEVSPAWLVARYKVTFERGFINEDRYYTDGSDIYFVSKEAGALVEQQLAQQRHRKRDQQQAQNREQWKDTEFYFEVLVFDQVVIDTIVQQTDSYLEIVEVNGQTYTDARVPQILASASEEAVIIQDKNGDQWVVQKDKDTGKTKIAKVEGGGLKPGSSTISVQADPVKDKIIVLILEQFEEEIAAWLRINGKGGEDDPDVMLGLAMPACFKKDADALEYIQNVIIPYFKSRPRELRTRIESDQSSNELLQIIAKSFGKESDVELNKINKDNLASLENKVCENLPEAPITPNAEILEKIGNNVLVGDFILETKYANADGVSPADEWIYIKGLDVLFQLVAKGDLRVIAFEDKSKSKTYFWDENVRWYKAKDGSEYDNSWANDLLNAGITVVRPMAILVGADPKSRESLKLAYQSYDGTLIGFVGKLAKDGVVELVDDLVGNNGAYRKSQALLGIWMGASFATPSLGLASTLSKNLLKIGIKVGGRLYKRGLSPHF